MQLHQLHAARPAGPPIVVTSSYEDDPKFHSAVPAQGAASLYQRIRTKAGQLANAKAPASVVAALMFICLWAGATLTQHEVLPTPEAGGPMGHSRTLKLASVPSSVASAAILTDSDIEQFEPVALQKSGFSKVRPALTPGESGESFMRAVPFQTISWYPRITYYPGFLTQQQADHVIELAKTYMAPSGLAYRPGESIPETQEVRTSTGCFLVPQQDKGGVLGEIERKIAAVTHLPIENGEAFNVLRYQIGQHYDSHMDAFDPKEYGAQTSQRIATLLIFLRAPEEGGETVFKREGLHGWNRTISDWRTCSDGLGIKVKPQTGDAVLFWSAGPDLALDPRSLHGACPVVRGQKWSMAKWIREKPQMSLRQVDPSQGRRN